MHPVSSIGRPLDASVSSLNARLCPSRLEKRLQLSHGVLEHNVHLAVAQEGLPQSCPLFCLLLFVVAVRQWHLKPCGRLPPTLSHEKSSCHLIFLQVENISGLRLAANVDNSVSRKQGHDGLILRAHSYDSKKSATGEAVYRIMLRKRPRDTRTGEETHSLENS